MIRVHISVEHGHGEIEINEVLMVIPHDTEGYKRALKATADRAVQRAQQAIDPKGEEA